MPDDALAKAAEAIRKCLTQWFCNDCKHWYGLSCSPPDGCKLGELYNDNDRVEDLARSVLEAAGLNDSVEVIKELMTLALPSACLEAAHLHCQCPVVEWPEGGAHIQPDWYCPCRWAEVIGRAKAALQRAGKG